MDRKGFGAILDETVSKMEHDVRVLKTQSVTLTENIKLLEKTRDKLSQEIAEGEQKLANVEKEYKDIVKKMLSLAQEKVDKATEKEAQAAVKLGELTEKRKEADALLSSNQGTQKRLAEQEGAMKDRVKKFVSASKIINETLKDL